MSRLDCHCVYARARPRASAGMRAGTPATIANGGTSCVDDRAGADDGALADRDARQDRRRSMPMSAQAPMRTGSISRSVSMIGTSTGIAGVRRAEHLGARSPADVLLDDQVAGVEIRLRADPDVVADDAACRRSAPGCTPARR